MKKSGMGRGGSAPKFTPKVNVETTYPAEVAMVKRIIDLANRAEIETPVVDPAERAKLAQEKQLLENRSRAVGQEIVIQNQAMVQAIEQVAQKALTAGIPAHKVDQYKKIALKGNDLSSADRATISSVTTVKGTSADQKKAQSAWAKITHDLALERQELAQKISVMDGKLNVMKKTANATPVDHQLQKIERVIKDVLGVGANREDIQGLVGGFSQLLRKGETTEALCTLIRTYKDKADSYVSRVERQMKGVSFNDSGSTDPKKEYEDKIAALRATIESLKQNPATNSEAEKTSTPPITSDRIDNYSMSVAHSYDESTSAVIITDDKTGKRIIADSESIGHFINESGEWNKKFIKQKFDREYIQEAQIEVTAHPEKHEEVFEKLVSRKVDLDDIELNNDDTRVAQLKDEDKALIYLLLTQKSAAEFEKQRIKEMSMVSSDISSDIVRTAFNTIDSRLASLAGIGASSDESEKKAFALHGVWVSGTYAKARQKEYGEVSGYKGKSGGGTVGVDFSVNDEGTIIGTSYSRIVSNITANQPVNSKIKAVSNILSVYTKIPFGNKFDLSAVLAGNNTRFTHKYQKMIGRGNYQTAKSKFTSNGFNAQMLLNYNITLGDNFMVMPRVGIQYGTQTDSAHTESGAGVHNLSIAAKNSKGFSGTAGLKLSKEFLVGNTHIIPSLLAAVQKDFSRSKDKIQARYVWASGSSTETHTFNRGKSLGYNLGAGLGVNHKNVEVLAEYNCHLKKKYVGHQGTLKLKLLF
ncbi:MAG: autotransporter outer membrane beta-barrel domain-containing protein [Rickettsiales bacterium]|nr:autotransporter outer membrane beta-barrel domain-containing protein [Rickettsiales bacterium]